MEVGEVVQEERVTKLPFSSLEYILQVHSSN